MNSNQIYAGLSLSDQAYHELVKRITRLEYPPGAVLSEVALVQEIGIGRTPMREALKRLAIEGLAVHQANRGMFVSQVTLTDVQEIYEFRKIIESGTSQLAVNRASKAQADELMRVHESLVEATENDDIDAYVAANRKYYVLLGEASKNSFLSATIPRMINLHIRLWFIISDRQGTWHDIAKEHQELTLNVATAIIERNASATESAINTYISQRQEDLRWALA